MPHNSQNSSGGIRRGLALLAACVAGLAITVPVEIGRLREAFSAAGPPGERGGSWASWLADVNIDTTPYFVLLLLAPVFWMLRRPLFDCRCGWKEKIGLWFGPETKPGGITAAGWRAWILAGAVGAASLAVSAGVSWKHVGGPDGPRFGDLPPAYHDEYSYIFQAKTFLAGRTWFPSHAEAPELFDQMHVLNDNGKFASRYFPGTGAWMAAFLAIGRPYWGHWLAGALAAVFVFWAGRELAGNGAGFLAGMLAAVSPGIALFSNLLLSHHPTLVGLSLFTFAFLRLMRTWRWTDALWAGIGLAFAMLCRPMTAAGVGLPFGLYFAWWFFRGGSDPAHALGFRLKVTAALAAPLVAGLVLFFLFNKSITGRGWVTPYSVYTNIYTPRHRYGFNNKVRGERHLGPKVLENYDRWAENLDAALAWKNVKRRTVASWQWTLGIVPLVMCGVLFLVMGPGDRRGWLLPAAIVSLHAVHVPYWFSGIMHWHYVFESSVYWLLIAGIATAAAFGSWRGANRPWMAPWWGTMLAVALATAYLAPEPFWGISRLQAGVEEVGFSRLRYAEFRRLVSERVGAERAIVLVDADPADRHIDYVVNDPGLDGQVLIGRLKPGATQLSRVVELFPDRAVYVFRERGRERRLERWSGPKMPAGSLSGG